MPPSRSRRHHDAGASYIRPNAAVPAIPGTAPVVSRAFSRPDSCPRPRGGRRGFPHWAVRARRVRGGGSLGDGSKRHVLGAPVEVLDGGGKGGGPVGPPPGAPPKPCTATGRPRQRRP